MGVNSVQIELISMAYEIEVHEAQWKIGIKQYWQGKTSSCKWEKWEML